MKGSSLNRLAVRALEMRWNWRYLKRMPAADPNRTVYCVKLKRELPALAKAPFPNEIGQLIYERVSKEAWDQWIKESVRYINTYRVDLSSREGTEFMLKQMQVYFGLQEGEMAETAWVAPSQEGE